MEQHNASEAARRAAEGLAPARWLAESQGMALPRLAAFSERSGLCLATLLLKLFPHFMAVGAP